MNEWSRRSDIDAKQAILGRVIAELNCEAVVLLMPAHVAWFTSGMNVRGLIADGERPGIYTNGRQRWLLCSNTDTQRLFDEELDGLGFMLKEWPWPSGRATLLGELVAGKKVATDRPFPTMPLVNEKLRSELRPLMPSDIARLRDLGGLVAHALAATARNTERGETEQALAGGLAHRLFHKRAEAPPLRVSAGHPTAPYPPHRARQVVWPGLAKPRGASPTRLPRHRCSSGAPADGVWTLQASGVRGGLYATASRTISFGEPSAEFRTAYEAACKVAAIDRHIAEPGGTIAAAVDTASSVLKNTPYEHEWRLSPAGYGTGWFQADELRKAGMDEKFEENQAIVWQARIADAGIVDTVLVGADSCEAITPPTQWPYKRITLAGTTFDIPDLLVL